MLFGFWYPAIEGSELRAGEIARGDAAGNAAGGGPRRRRAGVCAGRPVPASRHAAFLRASRGHGGGMLLPRLEIRLPKRAVPLDPFAGGRTRMSKWSASSRRAILATSATERCGFILPDCAARVRRRSASCRPELPIFSERYQTMHHAVEFPSDVDQGILGLLDPAHGPYVHQSWYWRSAHKLRDKEKTFEPIPNGFRMVPHAPSANSAAYKITGRVRAAGDHHD